MRHSLLRAHPDFGRYWLARLVSYAGDQIARTALLIAVFDRHGGAALGLLLIAATAPRLLGPALGALADRFDQRRIIVVCDVAQALIYVAVALLAPPLPVLLALIAAAATAATAFTPAGRSLLPRLVAPDRLGTANSQLAIGVNLGFAAGPALGGLLLAGFGLTTTLLLNAATFVTSAVLVAGIRALAGSAATRARPLKLILREGLTTVRANPVVRAVATGFLVMVTFAALDNVALIPFGRDDLGATPTEIGLLGSLYGIGMVVGPMLIARARMHLVLYAAFAALGLGTLLTGASPVITLALAGQALAGAGAGWHNVAADTLIQQHVPADRLGTVFGTVYTFPYAAELIAYAAGTALLTTVGPRAVLMISGLGILATLATIVPLLSRALPTAPKQDQEQEPVSV
jgi:MFS family permease